MKKRTKFELVIFVLVAAIYLFSQLTGRGGGQQARESTAAAVPSAAIQTVESIPETAEAGTKAADGDGPAVSEDGAYSDPESVALYLHLYGHLPSNYITKNKAKERGWDSSAGNLGEVCHGMSIGGDRFGNYEKLLPEKKGRKYFECDVNYDAERGYRGRERIIYSNDGLVYYTGDHYNSFELLYGEP